MAAKVQPNYFRLWESLQNAGGKPARAATHVQNALHPRHEFLHDQPVRRFEKEILQWIPVITSAPAIEFMARILRVISHGESFTLGPPAQTTKFGKGSLFVLDCRIPVQLAF